MNLYQLDKAIFEALNTALAVGVDDETGEIIEGSFDELEALSAERDAKLENIGLLIKNLQAEAEAIKEEAAALKERADAKARKVERLKDYVTQSMLNAEQSTFETSRVAFSFRKSEKVNILDEAALPAEFLKVKTETSPDKVALKKAIKAGATIAGAELVQNNSLQVK